MSYGTKHLIQCHCILPQFRNKESVVYHKFIVFSEIDDSDTVKSKYAQCNNCGVIHKIIDICKSEIAAGKDESRSILTIDDIKLMLPENLSQLLETYDCDLATFENAKYILDHQKWGEKLILVKENIEDEVTGKILFFESAERWRLETFSYSNTLEKQGSDE